MHDLWLQCFRPLYEGIRMILEDIPPAQWCVFVFAGMMVEAMFVIVVGMAIQWSQGWDWRLSTVYISWILTAVVFVWLNMKKTDVFVMHTILYLISVAIAFWFLCGVLKIGSEAVPLYIPICTDIGIFLGYGLEQIWIQWHTSFYNGWNWLLSRLPRPPQVTEADGPLLPLHHLPTPSPTSPPPTSPPRASTIPALISEDPL